MKNHLMLLALSILSMVCMSCEKEKEKGKEYKLGVDPGSLTFLAEGAAAQSVTVTAENIEWETALSDVSATWLHLEKKEGTVSVTVDDNPETKDRTAKFTVKSKAPQTLSKEVTVTQGGKDIILTVQPEKLDFEGSGAKAQVVTVTANVEWETALSDVSSTWLHLEKKEGAVSVTVDDNPESTERIAKFHINGVNSPKSVEITVTQAGYVAHEGDRILHASGRYMGDYYNVGASNFDLDMYTSDFDEKGGRIGNGYRIMVDFLSQNPVSLKRPEIAAGTYTINDSKKVFTAIPGTYDAEKKTWFYTNVFEIKDGILTGNNLSVKGGSFEVVNRGEGMYLMTFDFTLSDDTNFKAYYDGKIRVDNPALLSTLVDDLTVPPLVEGQISYFGDAGNDTYKYILALYTKGYNPYVGTGHIVSLELYTTITDNFNVVLPGKYTVNESYKAGTIVTGYMDGSYKEASWYRMIVNSNAVERAAIISGEVDLKYDAGTKEYTIVVNAFDDSNHRITANFKGTLKFRTVK